MTGWRTLVNGGTDLSQTSKESKPTTDTFEGTDIPNSWRAEMQASATSSDHTKIAVGGFSDLINAWNAPNEDIGEWISSSQSG